jgi:DNA-binding GntR family transcriptional regulator
MGVSITPVREALRDLAGEGLVVVDAHRGSRVHSLDLNEVRELYEMRIALEPLLVRRVIKTFPAENLQRCEALLRRLVVTTDRAQWSELNRELHSLLAGDHQGRLSVLLGGLRDSASRYVALSLGADEERIEQSNAEHADLIDAYRAGDARRAVALTVQHLRATLATIEAAASGAGDAGLSG